MGPYGTNMACLCRLWHRSSLSIAILAGVYGLDLAYLAILAIAIVASRCGQHLVTPGLSVSRAAKSKGQRASWQQKKVNERGRWAVRSRGRSTRPSRTCRTRRLGAVKTSYVTLNKPRLAGFKVHKLTFGKEPYSLQSRLPREYRSQVRPLAARSEQLSPRKRAEDGRTFTVDKFHKELSHFIKA